MKWFLPYYLLLCINHNITSFNYLGKVLKTLEFVSMPEPGVRVPDGGHNLPASPHQVSLLRVLCQPPYQPPPVHLVDVEHQGRDVDEEEDDAGQDDKHQDDGRHQPLDEDGVVYVYVLWYWLFPLLCHVDQSLLPVHCIWTISMRLTDQSAVSTWAVLPGLQHPCCDVALVQIIVDWLGHCGQERWHLSTIH